MAGVKGRTGRHANRSNQWLAGTAERSHSQEVFAFKPRLEIVEEIKQDIETKNLTKAEWLHQAAEAYLHRKSGEGSGAPLERIHALLWQSLAIEKKKRRVDASLVTCLEEAIAQVEKLISLTVV